MVPGTDGRKMSKSYGNTIPLFATRDEITKAVMSIVTDSGSDIPTNVYNIHKLVRSEADLKVIYEENKGKYKILKEKLIEDLDAFIKPMRDKRAEIANNSELIKSVLADGAKRAKKKADAKLLTVKKNIGVL
jgi:tryptophanyl-tRNA synthetase